MIKKKVCHFTTVHPPFDIRIYHKECKSLVDADYEVVLIAQNDGDQRADGIILKGLPKPGNRWMRITRLPWQGLTMVINEKPMICHFHDPELIPAGILMKCMGMRVVYDVHEDYPRSLLSNDRTWLPAWCGGITAGVVSLMEWFGAWLFDGIVAATPTIAKRFPPGKTVTLQNYPIPNELINDTGAPYGNRSANLVYTGAISRLRGFKELLLALDLLPGGVKPTLFLAGIFDSQEYESEVRQLTSWRHVDFRGWLSRKDIADLMGRAKIGVVAFHPVPNHVNAQPNKLFEYMSAGIPVVASDFPLWREIILGARCGLLVNPLDPADISKAILWLLENPEEAEAMGKRGKLAVEEKFNWNMEKKKLRALYDDILS
jgi:glycosyltransferase involved in cell wall biosynthesis